jgi:hypothetical protein
MNKTLIFIYFLIVAACSATSCYSSSVSAKITFNNQTTKPIIQTQEPYLDNYSYISGGFDFQAPDKTIAPSQSTSVTISFPWRTKWYGASQYSYNYEGRSKDYGCFVTEIRLSTAYFFIPWNYNVVIASYRKDPNFPDDYLVCTAGRNSNTDFTIHLMSSSQDQQTDDTKRYTIAGDNYLKDMVGYGLDLPISLNPTLTLYPNKSEPEVAQQPQKQSLPKDTKTITIVNHTDNTLIAGPAVLNNFSRFTSQNYVEQSPEILPKAKQAIKIVAGFAQRFNYHIKDYDEQSGCYITTNLPDVPDRNNITTVVSSFFDKQHETEKNLYCVMTAVDTVEVFDAVKTATTAACGLSDLQDCISYYDNEPRFLRKFEFSWDAGASGSYKIFIDPLHFISVDYYKPAT